MTGQIKTWIENKMFGFIRCEEDGKEYFFHRDDLLYTEEHASIRVGQTVNFNGRITPKGPRASEITFGG